MLKLTLNQQKQLNKLGIDALYVFGSRATGFARTNSDLDIGVIIKNPSRLQMNQKQLFEKIYQILAKATHAMPIKLDVGFLQSAPITLQIRAVTHGKLIFGKQKSHTLYKENIMSRHADIKYLLDMRAEAILQRI